MDIRRTLDYENSYANWYNEPTVQFQPNHPYRDMESVDSGENSPPMWKNISPGPSHPLLDHHQQRTSSPDCRAQAIARGQWELMEMVRNMPESSYELSLKDLVENYQEIKRDGDGSLEKNRDLHRRAAVRLKEESKKINYDRKKGPFLNMVFPFSLKSVKKKRRDYSKGGGGGGGGEREWWKKKFTGSSDSDSSRTSHNSGGSTTTTTTVSSGGGSSSSFHSGGGCSSSFHSGRGRGKEMAY
ncbi:hypothetical protein OROMI_030614 [Orobanche minor]